MAYNHGRGNILHCGSNKFQLVSRSVMAAELQALTLGFDYVFFVKDFIDEILGVKMIIEAMIDSKHVFNVVEKDCKTAERRLQIDILALRKSYDLEELDRIAWIPASSNPADSLNKPVLTTKSPLFNIMEKNLLNFKPKGWAFSHKRK